MKRINIKFKKSKRFCNYVDISFMGGGSFLFPTLSNDKTEAIKYAKKLFIKMLEAA